MAMWCMWADGDGEETATSALHDVARKPGVRSSRPQYQARPRKTMRAGPESKGACAEHHPRPPHDAWCSILEESPIHWYNHFLRGLSLFHTQVELNVSPPKTKIAANVL